MTDIVIVPIVEGHGEEASVRTLLQRIWFELLGGAHANILRPIRRPKSKLVQSHELSRAVELAALKLRSLETNDPKLVLILVDADKDPPCQLGPGILAAGLATHSDLDIACVVANVEYETWFVACASSLAPFITCRESEIPLDPEGSGAGKRWIASRFKGIKYSETVDQPRMTAMMDLFHCRERSPSFDKLCRELAKRVARNPGS